MQKSFSACFYFRFSGTMRLTSQDNIEARELLGSVKNMVSTLKNNSENGRSY